MSDLLADVRYALRGLRRSPGFTLTAVLTLALGIGANTAIFSVADAALFRPLPFEEPDELVSVWADWSRLGGPTEEWPNFPNLWELREQSDALAALGMWSGGGGCCTLAGNGPTEQVVGAMVSHDMLGEVLRVAPALGRGFTPGDDRPGAPRTVLLSDGFFRRAFGADPAVLGRTLGLDGEPATVIGVMPAGFRPPFIPQSDVWLPLRMDMAEHACGRGNACLRAMARLAEGATLASARGEAREIGARQEAAWPEANTGRGWTLIPLREDLAGETRSPLLVLVAAAALVLLIACVNQAGLLLARSTVRRGELAVRSALGAGRVRIVRQLLIESLVLALAGGAVAMLAAFLLTDLLVALAPVEIPRFSGVAVDGRVLAFSAVLSVAAGLLFGTLPALRGAGRATRDAVRVGRGHTRTEGVRARSTLVTAQVALAMVLLVGTGLLVRSLRNLTEVDLGFEPDGVLTFRVSLPPARYDQAATLEFVPRLEERLAGLPGVVAVGATNSPPLVGVNTSARFHIEGRPALPPERVPSTWYGLVTPGLPTALGIEVLRGRAIGPGDGLDAAPVVVISESFARRHFPGEDPIGRRLRLEGGAAEWRSIVGVIRDVRHFGPREEPPVAVHVPFAQMPASRMYVALRTESDPAALASAVREAVASLDPDLTAAEIAPFSRVARGALAPERFLATLLSLFGIVAIVLAVVGLYGVVSFHVNTRVREIGVRLALGADGVEVGAAVVRRSMRLVFVGMILGVAGALGLTGLLEGLLFGVAPTDPLTFVVGALVLTTAAVLAAALPARRAARLDPATALRAE